MFQSTSTTNVNQQTFGHSQQSIDSTNTKNGLPKQRRGGLTAIPAQLRQLLNGIVCKNNNSNAKDIENKPGKATSDDPMDLDRQAAEQTVSDGQEMDLDCTEYQRRYSVDMLDIEKDGEYVSQIPSTPTVNLEHSAGAPNSHCTPDFEPMDEDLMADRDSDMSDSDSDSSSLFSIASSSSEDEEMEDVWEFGTHPELMDVDGQEWEDEEMDGCDGEHGRGEDMMEQD